MSRRRHKRFQFTEKTHSKKGIFTLVMAVILFGIYLACLFLAYRGEGNLPVYYGSVGIAALIVTFVAVILAIQSMREENSFQIFPRAAFLVALTDLFCWGGTYVYGFMLLY